jgi:hypothetical protein
VKKHRCFTHKEVFPVFIEIINNLCKQSEEATFQRTVEELLKATEGVVSRASARCPERSTQWLAENMVKWLSKEYTHEPERPMLREFYKRFDRRDDEGSATYFVRKP